MSVPIAATVPAQFLRAGDVIRWGSLMQVTLTEARRHTEDGAVLICLDGTDNEGRRWVQKVPGPQPVVTIDTVAQDENLAQMLQRAALQRAGY